MQYFAVQWWALELRPPGWWGHHHRPMPMVLADAGPALDPVRGAPWWKVYLPGFGLFRYRMDRPIGGVSRETAPLVTIERGNAFGWAPEDGESVRVRILKAHVVMA